jgi:hypothetical protein
VTTVSGKPPACLDCRHFRNDAAFIERAFPGLSTLGSAWGSARSDDGICAHHERHVSAHAFCADFAERTA